MSDKRLKPCPFCGCLARLYFDIRFNQDGDKWFTVVVKCWSCDAQGQYMMEESYSKIKDHDLLKTLEDGAIWRWNRRAVKP